MSDKLEREIHFQTSLLKITSHRQKILASNIANVDTPGYQARDIDFFDSLQDAMKRQAGNHSCSGMVNTVHRHIPCQTINTSKELLYRIPDQPSADGNTVDMNRERISFSDNAIKYQVGLEILRDQFKNMMTVLHQG